MFTLDSLVGLGEDSGGEGGLILVSIGEYKGTRREGFRLSYRITVNR